MTEVECERNLWIAAHRRFDTGSAPAERMAPIGADNELRRPWWAGRAFHGDAVICGFDRLGRVFYTRKQRQFAGAFLKSRHQEPILDIVAEGIETDFTGIKQDLRPPQ